MIILLFTITFILINPTSSQNSQICQCSQCTNFQTSICNDQQCIQAIAPQNPTSTCTATQWSAQCAQLALQICSAQCSTQQCSSTGGNGNFGDCCQCTNIQPGGFCQDPTCSHQICQMYQQCQCQTMWATQCTSYAVQICNNQGGGGSGYGCSFGNNYDSNYYYNGGGGNYGGDNGGTTTTTKSSSSDGVASDEDGYDNYGGNNGSNNSGNNGGYGGGYPQNVCCQCTDIQSNICTDQACKNIVGNQNQMCCTQWSSQCVSIASQICQQWSSQNINYNADSNLDPNVDPNVGGNTNNNVDPNADPNPLQVIGNDSGENGEYNATGEIKPDITMIAGIVGGVFGATLIIGCIAMYCVWRKGKKNNGIESPNKMERVATTEQDDISDNEINMGEVNDGFVGDIGSVERTSLTI